MKSEKILRDGPATPAAPLPVVRSAQSSRAIPFLIPAAGVEPNTGVIIPTEATLAQSGDRFYVLALSCSNVLIQPVSGAATGAGNPYGIFQGARLNAPFDTLTVKNPNTFPITGLVWVGFDDFINDQLTLISSIVKQVINPTYDVAVAPANTAPVPDLSGTIFTDANGKKWGAISRVTILIFNTRTAGAYYLQKSGATNLNQGSVAVCQPDSAIRVDAGGSYTIHDAGGVIAVISEIYNAFAI